MQHGHVLAKAAAKAPHRLGREGDLGHQDYGPAPAGKGALDGVQVDLGLAGARHAVHQHHAAGRLLAGRVDGREGLRLARREALRPRGGRAGERGCLRAAHAAARVDLHHAALGQGGHGARGAGDGGGELGHALRALAQGLQDGALAAGALAGGVVVGRGRKAHPSLVDRAGLLADQLPGGVRGGAGHADLLAGRQEGTDRLAEGAGVLCGHPAGHAGGGGVKGGLGQDLRHRPHAAGRHARGGLLVDVHDVAHDVAPREGHEHRCSHGRRGGKAVGHEVVVGRVYGAGRYVERDAGVAHGPSSLLVHLAGVCCRNLSPAGH